MFLRFKHKKNLNLQIVQILSSHLPLSCTHSLAECCIQSLEPLHEVIFLMTSISVGESILSLILNSCQPQVGTYHLTEVSGRFLCCLSASPWLLPLGEGVMDLIGQMEGVCHLPDLFLWWSLAALLKLSCVQETAGASHSNADLIQSVFAGA